MINLERLRGEYEELKPVLERLAATLQDEVERAAGRVGIRGAHIECGRRVKDTDSLLTKAVRKRYSEPLRTMSDKVGVRADLLYGEHVEQLVAELQRSSEYEVADVDRKLDQLGDDRLGYIGTHVDVVPHQPPCSPQVATCEIQVRTRAQATWAMVSHDLLYKTDAAIEVQSRRRMNRLTALVELFDEEVSRTREAVMETSPTPVTRLLGVLESEFYRLGGEAYDSALTYQIVQAIAKRLAPEDIRRLAQNVSDDVERAERLLAGTFEVYAADARGALLRQPETLLIFSMLEREPHRLKALWQEEHDVAYLEQLAAMLGRGLPEPA